MDLSRFLRRRSGGGCSPCIPSTASSKSDSSGFSVLYKTKAMSSSSNRIQRSAMMKDKRKTKRDEKLKQYRQIPETDVEIPASTKPSSKRRTRTLREVEDGQQRILKRLEEFREKKRAERERNQLCKKPIFKVGVVHHKPYPFEQHHNSSASQTFNFGTNKKMSAKVMIKRSESSTKANLPPKSEEKKGIDFTSVVKKLEDEFRTPNEVSSKENVLPSDPNPLESPETIMTNVVINRVKVDEIRSTPRAMTPHASSLPPLKEEDEEHEEDDDDIVFKTPKVPISSRTRARSRSEVSPLLDSLRKDICFVRGSTSDQRRARRGLPPKLTSPMDNLINDLDNLHGRTLNKEFEDLAKDEKGTSEFRDMFEETKLKLTNLCDEWEGKLASLKFNDEKQQDEIHGKVLTVVGQGRLVMNDKGRLHQFSTLIDNCAFNMGEKETTCEDLQGFWDMIYIQIESIYNKFQELEDLEKRDWITTGKEGNDKQSKQRPKKPPRKPKKETIKSTGGLREMLAQRRAAIKKNAPSTTLALPTHLPLPLAEGPQRTFEGGFFSVSSPIRPALKSNPSSPQSGLLSVMKTPISRRSSLLSSDALLKSANSIMKVSSSARRSISRDLLSPCPRIVFDDEVKSIRRPSLLPGMSRPTTPVHHNLDDDLMGFNTPTSKESQFTPVRRSLRLSCKKVEPQDTTRRSLQISETPECSTPRRSKRLSTSNINYKGM